MPNTQMKRLDHLTIAKCLVEALRLAEDGLDELLDVYRLAAKNFTRTEGDIDPACIILGVQADALHIRTLCTWLDAVSTVTNSTYRLESERAMERMRGKMSDHGIVIPDTLLL